MKNEPWTAELRYFGYEVYFLVSQILPKINISKKTSVVYELICDDGSFKAKFNIKNYLNPSQNDSNFNYSYFEL